MVSIYKNQKPLETQNNIFENLIIEENDKIKMSKRKLKIERRIYPDFENSITPKEINEKLKKFGVSINFLFDDGIEFIYDSTLEVRYFPGDVSFVDKARNVVVLSYLEGFSSIEFFIGGNWADDDSPYLQIPIYDFLRNK